MLVYKRGRSTTCAYRALCIVRVLYADVCNILLHHITPPPNFAPWWYTRIQGPEEEGMQRTVNHKNKEITDTGWKVKKNSGAGDSVEKKLRPESL